MLLEDSANAQSPGHGYGAMSRMSTFSVDWTIIAAMLECHAEHGSRRPVFQGLQPSEEAGR
jgi:hypothetical protein